jgi:hypothetical protein
VIEKFELSAQLNGKATARDPNGQCPAATESSPLMFCVTRKHVHQWCIDNNEEPLTDREMAKLFLILHQERSEIIDNGLYRVYGLDQP